MNYGNAFLAWLPLAAGLSGVCLLIGLAVQQDLRQSFNDPQVQIAEDAAISFKQGSTTTAILKNYPPIDISKSLSAWVAFYNQHGEPLGTSGRLEGVQPIIPQGVFNAAATNNGKSTQIDGQNRITWQPKEGVRVALVVLKTDSGFVASGRNMSELEIREGSVNMLVFFAWIAILITTFFLQIATQNLRRH
jgi:hypothetical protein